MLGQISKRTVFRHTHVKGIHIHWDGDSVFETWVDGKLQETFIWEDGKLWSVNNLPSRPTPDGGLNFNEYTPPTEIQAQYTALSFFEEQGYR